MGDFIPRLKRKVKARVAGMLPASFKFRYLSLLPEFGRWVRYHGCDRKRVAGRRELYQEVAAECGTQRPIDYLEFGV